MLFYTLIASTVLSYVTCAPAFDPRDNAPSDKSLLLACPGAAGMSFDLLRLQSTPFNKRLAGSVHTERADSCTLINIKQNPDNRTFVAIGDPQLKYDRLFLALEFYLDHPLTPP